MRNLEFYQSIWKQSCLQGTGLVNHHSNKVFQVSKIKYLNVIYSLVN